MGVENIESFAHCLSELKRSQTQWSTVVLVRLQSFNLLYLLIMRAFVFYLVFPSLYIQVLYFDSSSCELFGLFIMICLPFGDCLAFLILFAYAFEYTILILSISHPNIITKVLFVLYFTRKLLYLCYSFEIYNVSCCFYL